jgi:hypothetical protein
MAKKINPNNKKAKNKLKKPTSKHDPEHRNPHIPVTNETHLEELNQAIDLIAEKFGIDTVVVTHYLDGSAVGVAQKARLVLDGGAGEGLPRKLKNFDDTLWVPLRLPVSAGTVS